MPDFEVFRKGARAPGSMQPFVTLRRSGNFAVSPGAWDLLGKPAAVHLLYAAEDEVVGMKMCTPSEPDAYVLRGTPDKPNDLTVAGGAFIRHYGLDDRRGQRFPAYMDDDVLCFKLAEGDAIKRPTPRVIPIIVPPGGEDTDVAKHIRRWAIERGLMSESTRGPLPGKIRRQYEAEQRSHD